jgi:hypothetical protein
MKTYARDTRLKALLEAVILEAEGGRPKLPQRTTADLDAVFQTTTRGLREILLLITLVRIIDPSYKASEAFYRCNPRALFEGPIREVLAARGIPHGKSGPLNVAKATEGINASWAAQRRPAGAANSVVRLVKEIESGGAPFVRRLAVEICARFLQEASRVESLTVQAVPESDPVYLHGLVSALIAQAPDAGNTPQRVIGYLLAATHESTGSGIKVLGHTDRASVTSTTSKKPGDIREELPRGRLGRVFEVTVKPFTVARGRESYQALRAYDSDKPAVPEIMVICRAEDVPPSAQTQGNFYLGYMDCEDLRFHFIDINEWIFSELLGMPPSARLGFYEQLASYIREPNTAEKVKTVWRALHE